MARICVTIDVSCGSGAVETSGLEGTWSVGVLPGGGEPELPPEKERKEKIKEEKDKKKKKSSKGTDKPPAGTAYGGGATSQGGTAEPTASSIKATAEKAGAGNVTMKCNSDNSICIVCFDADHFDWRFTGQFEGWVEIQPAGWAGPADPKEKPKTKGGGQTGGGAGGGIKRNISWPAGIGGALDGDGDGNPKREFLVIRCGMVPDESVRTELTLFFYGDLGSGTAGLRRLTVTVPNPPALDAFAAMDRLENAIREIGAAVFRVSGNAIAVPADADFLPGNAICVSFRAQMTSFPGIACTGSWIAETEVFSVAPNGDSVPSVLPLLETPLSRPASTIGVRMQPIPTEAVPAAHSPRPGPTTGTLGGDPRVPVTVPEVHPALTPSVSAGPRGEIASDSRRTDATTGFEAGA